MEINYSIYIRPLLINDADRTVLWSNDPELWEFSKGRWSICSHMDMEIGWIKYVLEKTTDRYFAICINSSNQHIGNIQLTNIAIHKARCCVVIGEKSLWGKGLATRAIMLAADYAFSYRRLDQLYIEIHRGNVAALSAYKKCGFVQDGIDESNYVLFKLSRKHYFAMIGKVSNNVNQV